MSTETQTEFGVGQWWTIDGYEAMVDAVADGGLLIGRVNIQTDPKHGPLWEGYVWNALGISQYGATFRRLCASPPAPRIKASYWLNIYPSGPGLLRKTWEEALIEASRSEEEVLARKEIKIDARVGEGLK